MGDLLTEIEAHIAFFGVSASRLGRGAVNDPAFVAGLREGREVRAATADKVRGWLERDRLLRVPPVPPPSLPGGLSFRLDQPTPLLNQLARMHWKARMASNRRIGGLVRLATHGQRPAAPFPRALVRIERRSLQVPDTDNLVGGVKGLVDALLPPGAPYRVRGRQVVPHPTGLSIVEDDNPARMVLEVLSTRVRRRAEQCTVVSIFPLPLEIC